jgi:predicted transcriptional regulator
MGEGLLKGTMGELDLIDRHLLMLKATRENQPIGIIRLSEITGIPRHKVRYSLRLLEKDGLIVATQEGAVVSDRYTDYLKELESSLEAAMEKAEEIRKKVRGSN